MIKPFTKVEKSLVFLRVKESGIYISKDLNPYIDTDSTSTLTPIEGGVETVEGESESARIERLGRQRPEKLGTLWKEICFVFAITMASGGRPHARAGGLKTSEIANMDGQR